MVDSGGSLLAGDNDSQVGMENPVVDAFLRYCYFHRHPRVRHTLRAPAVQHAPDKSGNVGAIDHRVSVDIGAAAVAVRVGGVKRDGIEHRFDEQHHVIRADAVAAWPPSRPA